MFKSFARGGRIMWDAALAAIGAAALTIVIGVGSGMIARRRAGLNITAVKPQLLNQGDFVLAESQLAKVVSASENMMGEGEWGYEVETVQDLDLFTISHDDVIPYTGQLPSGID